MKHSIEAIKKMRLNHPRCKTVEQLDGATKEHIKTFISTKDAERVTGVKNTHISSCCNGKRKTAGTYMWVYV